MGRVYVGIGSNIDSDANIRLGIKALKKRFGHLLISPVYESKAVGFRGPDFYNLVVGFDVQDTPENIVEILHEIESEFGRIRDKQFISRTLDLDLLLFENLVLDKGRIQIPRQDILDYAFVLRPLADLNGEGRHPVLNLTYDELWEAFEKTDQDLRQVDMVID